MSDSLLRFLSQHIFEHLANTFHPSDELLQRYLELVQQDSVVTYIQHAIDYEYSKQQLKSLAKVIFGFPIGGQLVLATQLWNYSVSLKSKQIHIPSPAYTISTMSVWSAWMLGKISPVEIYKYLNLAVDCGDIGETGRGCLNSQFSRNLFTILFREE